MKLTKIISTTFILCSIGGFSQDVASTATLTSGGLDAGSGGNNNTFYGHEAGKVTTGSQNTFIGHQTGQDNTIGTRNIFIGVGSGYHNTAGNDNVFIGNQSANESLSGSGNTIIGSGAGSYGNGSRNVFIGQAAGETETGDDKLYISNYEDTTPLIWGDFAQDQLKLNGKVGIGNGFPNFPTTAGAVNVSGYNLFVKGGILTEEVRVSTNWADFVFENDYDLKPLSEVENFIKANKHLPEIPSAKEVESDGIELGEMNKLLLQKVEELTLYLIEQDKQIQELKKEVKILKSK